jgi:hypothetical protein
MCQERMPNRVRGHCNCPIIPGRSSLDATPRWTSVLQMRRRSQACECGFWGASRLRSLKGPLPRGRLDHWYGCGVCDAMSCASVSPSIDASTLGCGHKRASFRDVAFPRPEASRPQVAQLPRLAQESSLGWRIVVVRPTMISATSPSRGWTDA